jgi:Putative bacterial sensory transduction regulator
MRLKLGLAAGLLGLAAMSAPAVAQTIMTEVGAGELVPVFTANGWTAEPWLEDGKKSSYIAIEFEGLKAWAELMDCPDETFEGCRSVLLFANFELDGKISPDDVAHVNTFNDSQPLGRAYYFTGQEGRPDQVGVDYRISFDGGITPEHLTKETLFFRDAVVSFGESFGAE